MIDPKQLADLANKYAEERGFISNEEESKAAFVVPLVKLLGYDPNSPREVRREYAAPFTQNDGKRLPDRMDLAIFDQAGMTPRFVIECKPLGTDLRSKSPQLARYVAQIADLHFGIMTDGCHYLFYGDLENPNQMDPEPFYCFSLDDPNTDWTKVAKELGRFDRDSFNATTLVTDAENAKYRQAMIDKLARALKVPGEDEAFLRWLSEGIYKGTKTAKVLARLSDIAKEAVEPAMMKVMSNDFIEKLRTRLQEVVQAKASPDVVSPPAPVAPQTGSEPGAPKKAIVTTDEERAFFGRVKEICVAGGFAGDDIIWSDTTNYFNVSYKKPWNWFIRYFGDSRRKNITTRLSAEEAKALCPGFFVEACPTVFGTSRVYIESVGQVAGLGALILKSLQGMIAAPAEENQTQS